MNFQLWHVFFYHYFCVPHVLGQSSAIGLKVIFALQLSHWSWKMVSHVVKWWLVEWLWHLMVIWESRLQYFWFFFTRIYHGPSDWMLYPQSATLVKHSELTTTSLEWLVLGKETLVILQQADSSCEISHPQKSNEQSLGSMVSDFAFLAIRLGSSREKNGRLLLWNWTHVQRRPWPGTLTWHYSIIPSYLIGFNGKNCMILPPVW